MRRLQLDWVSTLIVAFALSTLAPAASRAAPPALLPRAVLFADPPQGYPQVSPDGATLGWLAPDARGILQIHLGSLDGSGAHPVTAETRPIRRWLWSEDGRQLLFFQDAFGDENNHLFLIEPATGQVRDLTPFRGVRVEDAFTSAAHPRTVKVTLNLRDRSLFDVHRVDLDTGAVALEVQNPGGVVDYRCDGDLEVRGAVRLLPDGGTEVLIREAAGTWRSLLRAPLGDILSVVSFPAGGRKVLLLSSLGGPAARLVERDLVTGAERVLAEDREADAIDVLVDHQTGAAESAVFEGPRMRWRALAPGFGRALEALGKLAPDADVVPITRPFVEGGDPVSRDNARRIVVAALTRDRAATRYAVYDAARRKARYLFEGAGASPPDSLAEVRPVVIRARDGLALPSYLALPAGVPAKRLPLVLLVHGGPTWRDSWGWHPITQWLANRGYAVLRVNFRGSTGFGRAHRVAGFHEIGRKMQDDLGDAVAWAVREGYADPDRIAIMGKSYGGYAALAGAALTPDLYRCAVSYVGVADLVSLVRGFPTYWAPFTARIKAVFGDPDDLREAERMRSVSPLYLADRISIPLLVGQGANDVRVKKEQVEAIVAAVEKAGGRATYVLYPDEGHGPAGLGPDSPANRIDWYARVEAFLARNLGGRAESASGPALSTSVVREVGSGPR